MYSSDMTGMLSSSLLRGAANAARAPSTLVSRNVTVAGHRTSMRLEPTMWDALAEICRRENATLSEIATLVGRSRSASSLTSAMRIFILDYFHLAATEDGHNRAGHGNGSYHSATPRYQDEPAPAAAAAEDHEPVYNVG